MPRELKDIVEEIDQRVRDGLLAVDGEELDTANGECCDGQFWRHVGIVADIIRLLLEFRHEHATSRHCEAELRRGQQRIDALWPRCLRCQQAMSWRNNAQLLSAPDLHNLRLCRACKEAGFRLSDFGECPICHGNDGCKSISSDHWYYCDTHRTQWHIGSNLFSGWRDLTAEQWRQNADHLLDYREVEPSFWMSTKQAYRTGALYPPPLSEAEDVPF